MRISLPTHIHAAIYFIGLSLMAIGLSCSVFLMSFSQILLTLNWLVEGGIGKKMKSFFHNKAAVVVSSVFLLHIIGLFYSSDFNYAIKDLRIKLPLLILPLILSTSPPLSPRNYQNIMAIFISTVFVATWISMALLLGMGKEKILDIRQISTFISHIRFSLLIDLSIFMLVYYISRQRSFLNIFFLCLLIAWFIAFLIILESLTGLLILLFTSFLLMVYFVSTHKKTTYKYIGLALTALFLGGLAVFLKIQVGDYYQKKQVDSSKLESHSAGGNAYFHDITSPQTENGNYVWQYLCWKELEEQWDKKSAVKFNERDLRGNEIKYTLIRYMTSMDLRKDSLGVLNLNEQDVQHIQGGFANVKYSSVSNFRGRIHNLIWEFDNYQMGGNPSGHSVMQRLEFWKASLGIIAENPLSGVGTGDVPNAFARQYEKMNSPLSMQWRLRAHNQFLSLWVAFGCIGLCWFLFSLVYPLGNAKIRTNYFYLVFLIIATLSMLTEDTLETQAGVSFFAFFNALFLFASPYRFRLFNRQGPGILPSA